MGNERQEEKATGGESGAVRSAHYSAAQAADAHWSETEHCLRAGVCSACQKYGYISVLRWADIYHRIFGG